MKRYMLFGIDNYYPSGGMEDFISDFEDLPEAIIAMHKEERSEWPCDRYEIYDLETKQRVAV